MKALFARIIAFGKEVLSENGVGSYSRIASCIITLFTCGWITYLVIVTRALPDLGGATLFVSGGVGVHYGVNKMQGIAGALKKDSPQQPSA